MLQNNVIISNRVILRPHGVVFCWILRVISDSPYVNWTRRVAVMVDTMCDVV